MSDGFIPLAAFLSPPPKEPAPPSVLAPDAAEDSVTSLRGSSDPSTEYAAAFGAVRRFRAAVADALEVAVQQLLAEIAENVLARELELGSADVGAIVAKTRERVKEEKIVAVRIHPRDREALGELAVDAVLDDTLVPGDIVAELRSGTIDLRLRARLDKALAACLR